MDAVTLRQYETLSPFEIKNDLAKVAAKTAKAVAGRLPERRTRQSELDRDRAALGVLPARPVRDHREPAHDEPAGRRRRHAEGARHRRHAWPRGSRRTPTCPGAALLRRVIPWAVETFGFDAGRVRARAGRLDHRRQLPGARPHARAQRADRPRVPAVGDVRRAAARRDVRPVRRRGRHGGDVLHLQVAEGEPAAERRRHDRAWRRRSSRRTSRCRTSRTTASNIVTIQARQEQRWQFTDADLAKLLDPAVKAFFVVNPGNPVRGRAQPRVDRRRSAACSRSAPTSCS